MRPPHFHLLQFNRTLLLVLDFISGISSLSCSNYNNNNNSLLVNSDHLLNEKLDGNIYFIKSLLRITLVLIKSYKNQSISDNESSYCVVKCTFYCSCPPVAHIFAFLFSFWLDLKVSARANMSAVSDLLSVTDNMALSPIKDFYVGKNVFLTGCTGAVGEVILEKLLRYEHFKAYYKFMNFSYSFYSTDVKRTESMFSAAPRKAYQP